LYFLPCGALPCDRVDSNKSQILLPNDVAGDVCSNCGDLLPNESTACPRCGTEVVGGTMPSVPGSTREITSESGTSEPLEAEPAATKSGRRPRRRMAVTAGVVSIMILAIVATLAIVPFSSTYAFSLGVCGGGSALAATYPTGATVVVHWYEPDGSQVTFGVEQGSHVLYQQTTVGGSFSFTTNGKQVTFGASSAEPSCTAADVQVYGHWTERILNL